MNCARQLLDSCPLRDGHGAHAQSTPHHCRPPHLLYPRLCRWGEPECALIHSPRPSLLFPVHLLSSSRAQLELRSSPPWPPGRALGPPLFLHQSLSSHLPRTLSSTAEPYCILCAAFLGRAAACGMLPPECRPVNHRLLWLVLSGPRHWCQRERVGARVLCRLSFTTGGRPSRR
jgi:hypothetical protein